MRQRILDGLKALLGTQLTKKIRPIGHGIKSYLAIIRFGYPARKLHITGITGTKGKTTTTAYMGRLANLNGQKTAYISTAVFNTNPKVLDGKIIGEIENPYKMSSIDGWDIQKLLTQIVANGCTHLIIELSSEGLAQNRHIGLGGLDVGIFLNIFPEHIQAHGSFENYKQAKRKLMEAITPEGVFVTQSTSPEWKHMWQGTRHARAGGTPIIITPGETYSYQRTDDGDLAITYGNHHLPSGRLADFEVENLMAAIIALQSSTLPHLDLATGEHIGGVPGRMQWAVYDDPNGIDILVDYAHEPESIKRLLTLLKDVKSSQGVGSIIHILSCDGAGRDDWKKPVMGTTSAELADFTIVTTDNYTSIDDPNEIVQLITQNIAPHEMAHIRTNIDRRVAFRLALKQAQLFRIQSPHQRVIIVSTGVGNEFGLRQPSGIMLWNEVEVWRKEFNNIG